jgi:hypothetical protein
VCDLASWRLDFGFYHFNIGKAAKSRATLYRRLGRSQDFQDSQDSQPGNGGGWCLN